MYLFRRLCSLGLLFSAPLLAQDAPPLLIIDSKGHSAPLKEVLFRPSANELISLGDDKAIRFWDLDSGELVRTLRGEIGDGPEGKLYCGALSGDGRFLAVGGYDADKTIRVIDLDSGDVAAVLRGHEAVIHNLDFSDEGLTLASSSSDHTVRVWDLSPLAEAGSVLEITESQLLEGHTEAVYALDFSPDGLRLVSGSDDDRMILWQRESVDAPFASLAVMEEHTNDVSAAAFSPAGGMIISGGFDNQLILWSGETGELIEVIDPDMGNSISAVCFSPDGQRVLASSQTAAQGTTAVYDLATSTRAVEFPLHDNSVRGVAWHPELNLVASIGGNDGDIYVWHPDADEEAGIEAGAVKHHLVGAGRTTWSVAFADDGSLVVAFGQNRTPDRPVLEEDLEFAFDFTNFELTDKGSFDRTVTEFDGSTLEKTGAYVLAVSDGGTIENDRTSNSSIRSFSFTHDGTRILVGSDFSLRSYSADTNAEGGHDLQHDFLGHNAVVWALSPSPDGRTLASASGDQTVRLWSLETGELLASLFVARDREWVCWTPSGHYHASPGGEQYIGWHFNRGVDHLGEFFPSYVFRESFHHPELVKRTIALASFEAAVAEVGAEPVNLDAVMPPRIAWTAPTTARGSQEETETTVLAKISSPNGELTELKLLLNGKAIQHYDLSDGTEFSYEETVTLNPGENRLTIFASNVHAGHTSEERVIQVPVSRDDAEDPDKPAPDDGLDELLKPNLYMLAVGVSEFANGDISALEYCDDDATAMAEFFQGQEGGLFAKTEVKLLVNGDATEAAIQEGLDWLEKSATQKDFVVLFLASHGCNDEKGKFYMIPHDCDPANLRSTGVAWEDFGEILGNLPSRVLMFLDTCHSGRLGANLFTMANSKGGSKTRSFTGLKSAFDNTEAIRELTSDEVGVVIMAASTGNESSLENEEWGHGAFTTAALSGLKGEADLNGDGIVHLIELDFFVAEKVKELTEGAQHPTTVKPSTISRLPVAAVAE